MKIEEYRELVRKTNEIIERTKAVGKKLDEKIILYSMDYLEPFMIGIENKEFTNYADNDPEDIFKRLRFLKSLV